MDALGIMEPSRQKGILPTSIDQLLKLISLKEEKPVRVESNAG